MTVVGEDLCAVLVRYEFHTHQNDPALILTPHQPLCYDNRRGAIIEITSSVQPYLWSQEQT